ncbi:MAG: Z-ring associated ZapG family protein [Planctomycetota bacterium]|jgi:uncharacterized membrane-anchored protein YhcB (DUF1043 family)
MEWSATILVSFGVGLVLGGVTVGLLRRRSGGAARERAEQLGIELDETREALEAQRAEVAKHFEETSGLFRDLTEQYTRLYAHLSEGAREFCPGEVPALGRGFDGPLLGTSGDSEPAEEPPADAAQPG